MASGSSHPLLSANAITAHLSGLGGDKGLFDADTGTKVAVRVRGLEFVDAEDGSVLVCIKAKRNRPCEVFGPTGESVGTIVPARRSDTDLRVIGWKKPMEWTGWVRLADSDDCVAFVRDGFIVSADRAAVVAELSLPPKFWFRAASTGPWTLCVGDGTTGPLRLMALGWLGLAWKMQYDIDNSD